MAAGSAGSSLVASRYASAFLDMAADAGAVEAVEKDLRELESMVAGSADLRYLLENPVLNRLQQQNAILALAEKASFHALTRNFLGVLAANRRLEQLPAVLTAFRGELMRRRGMLAAKVETAVALTPAQTQALQKELSAATGAQVTLDVTVNRALLGGMIVTVGSRMIDNSVKRKLELLQRAMNNNDQFQQKEVG